MYPLDYSFLTGIFLAFVLAVIAVLYDCHVAIKQRLKRVPMLIYRVLPALLLSGGCGLMAAIAFCFTDGKGDTLVDSVLGLRQPNPILRGVFVGLTVLVLIRSRISNIKGAEIGGELVYNSGRTWVMRVLNRKWRAYKTQHEKLNLNAALEFPDYEKKMLEELRDSLKTEDEEFRDFVGSQIRTVTSNRPATAFNKTSAEWKDYYRTLTNLALDYSGPEVFEGWIEFKDPRKSKPAKAQR